MIRKIGLVVVAAGSGTRFGGPKQFAPLGGRPLLAWCLEAFDRCEDIAERVVVLRADLQESAAWKGIVAGLKHPVRTVDGGAQRADSVRAGIEALGGACGIVAVHDGARPFPPIDAMRRCAAMLDGDATLAGAIVAGRCVDTLKAIAADGATIVQTIDRSRTARAETPQVCRRAELLAALARPGASLCTDEAQALESAGRKTAVAMHDGMNVKITTAGDVAVAEAMIAARGSE